MFDRRTMTIVFVAALTIAINVCKSPAATPSSTLDSTATSISSPTKLGVGLRRSSYGLRNKNGDDAWWAGRAKEYAAAFPGAQPVVIEIVSGYQNDGSTEFGFARPSGDAGPTDFMRFTRGKLDHERALSTYDAAGVQAIIQFEPGDADMLRCLEIAERAFGQHKCVIGYGIDAEWYRTKHSQRAEGMPVTDAEAKAWTEKLISFKKDHTLFIKHFSTQHLPSKYRHPQLWFLDDSQEFADREECLADFKDWAKFCDGSMTGFQFGYPADRKWWSKLSNPPLELGEAIRHDIPSCRYLFWVDFTADKVKFAGNAPAAEQ
jgi:hypothetical protein